MYISIDFDAFDPSIIPSTGTPEPGGLSWQQVLTILRKCITNRNIVGVDMVELSPIEGMHAPDFTAAKLLYRLMGYVDKISLK